ncbi:hypothetical protein E0H73_39665 [Kribbella pittospori]|uniref:Uncharacterized protein n=1 Tax=Kribbella pittospori TaxID=722689 RepID=A0A4R0K3Z1_9ACTN|nr:hypothetical protein [Kribbella pittospori]TCC54269.1 hypothetical protein E0H73_39665 [Kribbella pittospori]
MLLETGAVILCLSILVSRGPEMSESRSRAIALDFLERAGWSAGQLFFATLLAGGTAVAVTDLPWKYAGTLAIGAAVSSLVLTILQYLGKDRMTNLGFWPDTVVRLLKTFLASLAASFGAGVFNVFTFEWETALNLAFLATIGALGKGLLAREPKSETREPSPSTLPTETYATAVEAPEQATPVQAAV